ncbi:MAG: FeoB-associated Cys-rich membrane protein [bacterium]
MIDIIVGLVIMVILLMASGYVWKAKKNGVKCIGCDSGSSCGGSCPSSCPSSCEESCQDKN